MKETPSFVINFHKTKRPHYDITLTKDGAVRSWILPGGLPKEVSDRKIAIEESINSGEENGTSLKDLYGREGCVRWDSGDISISTENSIKYIFSASGEKFKGKYLLHNPSWGRWTKRKLWVLEKVPLK